MRVPKKVVLAIVAGAATAAAPAMANPVLKASAATASHGQAFASACSNTVSAGGGTWQYGACSSTDINFSYYYQPSRKHQSSVNNQKFGYKSSGCVAAGTWSSAVETYDPNGGNSAYYSNDVCS